MSKIAFGKNEDSSLIGVEIDGNISWFQHTVSGKAVANEFGKLFRWLTNPKLSQARLNKLQKNLGKDDNEAVT